MNEPQASGTEPGEKTIKHEIVPFEWAAKKLLGPTLDVLGGDLGRLYQYGRDQIVGKATEKTPDLDDGKTANLRVTKDVFFDGAFADEEICSEYFGGALACSRSEDGRDDSAIPFVDAIKCMSSKELRLHYLIYNALNSDPIRPTLGDVREAENLSRTNLFFNVIELTEKHEIDRPDVHLSVLSRDELIGSFKVAYEPAGPGRQILYAQVSPTVFGIMLYAVAHNRLKEWANFGLVHYGNFDHIRSLPFAERTLPDLMKHVAPTATPTT